MSARLFPRAYMFCGTLLYNNVLMKYCACQNNLETDECTSLKNSSGARGTCPKSEVLIPPPPQSEWDFLLLPPPSPTFEILVPLKKIY